MQKDATTATIADVLQQLINLKLDLIPIRPGGKVPLRSAWNVPVGRTVDAFLKAAVSDTIVAGSSTVEGFTAGIANIGVLNEPSHVVTLDCDSPLASKALQAACKSLAGDIHTLYPDSSWNSARGQKAMYRRPSTTVAGRTVFRVWQPDRGEYDVIFELRGTGQDVLPPSWREDAGVRLAWFHDVPTEIAPMPKWLAELNVQLAIGRGPAIDAMCEALGLTPEQRARTHSTSHSMTGYPVALVTFAAERAYVNAKFKVEDLLTDIGYERAGKRWKPGGSTHAPGIIAPRNDKENWLCEHESDPLAGVFDAWRIMVEHIYDGDAVKAAEETRREQKKAIKREPPPEPEPAKPVKAKKAKALPDSKPVREPDDEDHKPEGHTPKVRSKHGALPADFLTAKTAGIKPIVRGLLNLPPGMHLLSAMPKAGKSTLTTAIMLAVATGRTLSGCTTDTPSHVIFCAFDENVPQNLQPRMRLLMKKHNLPADLIQANTSIFSAPDTFMDWARDEGIDTQAPLPFEWVPDEAMEEGEAKARAQLLRAKYNPYSRALYHFIKATGARLCVVDVITKMRVKSLGMGNAYDRDIEEFDGFNTIGVKTSCAIIGVHHMNKAAAGVLSDGGSNSLAKVSGTNAIAGSVQSIISMSSISGRDADPETLTAIEPKGTKIAIDHVARDSLGLRTSAFSLVATHIEDEDTTAMEWIYMGPIDVLAGGDEKQFVVDWLFDQPAQNWMPATAIFAACVAAGIMTSRRLDAFRKILQRMSRAHLLDSNRGPGGGFRLSAPERAIVKAKRDSAKY